MESPTLRIRLLGALELRLGETALPSLESARAESLLAYLLLHRATAQSRQSLAFLLWPDSTEAQARTNLRHVLHNLRRALPHLEHFLEVTPRTLRWRTEVTYWLDVAAFEETVSQAENSPADNLAMLQHAVELYTGDLLAGCYDEWILGERERLLQHYLATLAHLAALLEARGVYDRALVYAERHLRLDPLREETYRLVMRLHDARGDRARSLRVYHACVATLEQELGVEPSVTTREAYEALLPAGQDTGLAERQGGRVGGLSLVGRATERARLATLWRTSEGGRAQLVLVAGEPGIGKTRLIEEFRSWCAHRGAVTAVARAYAAEGALAYGPVVAWLRADGLRPRPEQIDRSRLTDLARVLPELLTTVPGLAHPEPLPEGEQRQRLFEAVAQALLAGGGPLLLVADDLQWCDRETLQFLHYLLRVAPEARLLVAATVRREELGQRHPINDLLAGLRVLERYAEIDLGRLSQGETAILAERLTGSALGETGVARLYGETEGNPLFVVEALRAGWQAGRGVISPKVQAVIESRLAQLSEATRDLVGVAAAIGREFTADVLARASGVDEATLVRGLDDLWQRRIVREQGVDAYDFSHDLIREVAYHALSPARRRHHHLRIARALEHAFGDDSGPVSGQLAAHYDRAGAADQAVIWYGRAAEAMQQLHANSESVRLLDRALDLLRVLPDSPERQARELAILNMFPAALVAVEGFQSGRVTEVHRRALEIAQALAIELAPPLLRSLAIASLSHDDFAGARRFAAQLRARGERDADSVLLVESGYVLGVAAFWRGEFVAAKEEFDLVLARYHPERRRAHLLQYGQDPRVVCLIRRGYTLWFLGQPELAIQARDAGVALAGEIGHPPSRAQALVFAAMISLETRQLVDLRAFATQLVAGRDGYAWHARSLGDVLEGYLAVLDGRGAAGIEQMMHAVAAAPAVTPAPGHRAVLQRLLLEACVVAGDARTGLATVDRLLAMGEGAGLWEAETRRRRAEFLAALGTPDREVEAEFARALHVARRQGARSLELRVATSLFRHLRGRGDGPALREARDLLAALLDSFREGRDTPDLRDVAALLGRA